MIDPEGIASDARMRGTTQATGDVRDWATFEAEALPHVDRLFRLAMWFERNRDEAEDLIQECAVHPRSVEDARPTPGRRKQKRSGSAVNPDVRRERFA
jgi:hypothetical protein